MQLVKGRLMKHDFGWGHEAVDTGRTSSSMGGKLIMSLFHFTLCPRNSRNQWLSLLNFVYQTWIITWCTIDCPKSSPFGKEENAHGKKFSSQEGYTLSTWILRAESLSSSWTAASSIISVYYQLKFKITRLNAVKERIWINYLRLGGEDAHHPRWSQPTYSV